MTGYRAGQVAQAVGVNLQTLRYYERRGLLASPERTLGGHRIYPEETVTLLRVIKTAQGLGFTLDEVADLLDSGTHRHGGRPEPGLRARAETKIAEIDKKINALTAIRAALQEAVAAGCDDLVSCAGNACCPIPFTDLIRPEGAADAPTTDLRKAGRSQWHARLGRSPPTITARALTGALPANRRRHSPGSAATSRGITRVADGPIWVRLEADCLASGGCPLSYRPGRGAPKGRPSGRYLERDGDTNILPRTRSGPRPWPRRPGR